MVLGPPEGARESKEKSTPNGTRHFKSTWGPGKGLGGQYISVQLPTPGYQGDAVSLAHINDPHQSVSQSVNIIVQRLHSTNGGGLNMQETFPK